MPLQCPRCISAEKKRCFVIFTLFNCLPLPPFCWLLAPGVAVANIWVNFWILQIFVVIGEMLFTLWTNIFDNLFSYIFLLPPLPWILIVSPRCVTGQYLGQFSKYTQRTELLFCAKELEFNLRKWETRWNIVFVQFWDIFTSFYFCQDSIENPPCSTLSIDGNRNCELVWWIGEVWTWSTLKNLKVPSHHTLQPREPKLNFISENKRSKRMKWTIQRYISIYTGATVASLKDKRFQPIWNFL